jgi:hypothetical protein
MIFGYRRPNRHALGKTQTKLSRKNIRPSQYIEHFAY